MSKSTKYNFEIENIEFSFDPAHPYELTYHIFVGNTYECGCQGKLSREEVIQLKDRLTDISLEIQDYVEYKDNKYTR